MFLSIAAGLYYVAELVEEYTVAAKKVISVIVLFVTTVYMLFIFFDNLPWSIIICGLAAQALHALILTEFPYVKLMSVQFIGAVLLLLLNHYLAFLHFTQYYFNFTEVSRKESVKKIMFHRNFTHRSETKIKNFQNETKCSIFKIHSFLFHYKKKKYFCCVSSYFISLHYRKLCSNGV